MTDTPKDVAVSVIIACYNHAHYLAAAIESVLAQTHRNVDILVVDDGSPDNTGEVAARYAGVRCVRQVNQGLSAARNTGIRDSPSPYLVFLDADDRLLPNALAAGLSCFEVHPECAFVSGGFRRIGADGEALGAPVIARIRSDPYVEMLQRNYIRMHATVMFRRDVLEQLNGFDTSLRACEDYDLYLRVVRNHPVCCHGSVVAEYRRHTTNTSSDSALMLRTAVRVLRSQWRFVKADLRYREAYRVGMRFWHAYYGLELIAPIKQSVTQRRPGRAIAAALTLAQLAPVFAGRKLVRSVARRGMVVAARLAPTMLPGALVRRLRALGRVRFGDLLRVTPISRSFGFDRGLPIDRYYIEGFLFRCAGDIAGRVLEIADNDYTLKFGGARVVSSDILHVNDDNPRATILADLTDAAQIPADRFDCVILTQTLHFIYDVKAALRTLYRILKPGGTLLITSPGISQVGESVPGSAWYWAFTHESLRRSLEEVFPQGAVEVEAHGNVFAAVAFLHGLALQEVAADMLDHRDAAYPVIIAARAVKPHPPSS